MLYFKCTSQVDPPHWLANGQHKCHTKRCLEFEKNAAGCTTFVGQLTCWPETLCAQYLS